MPLRYAILWCLARGIRHGYDIRRALGEMTDGLWEINPGHVYQAFRALERDGLVTLTEIVPQHNLPDRKEYALTPAGQIALAQWIGKPVPAERPNKDEALLKLVFLVEQDQPEALTRFLAAQRRIYERDRDQLTAQVAALPPADRTGRLMVQAALEDLEANLRWLTHAQATLTDTE
ncbi:MAG: PadR family transcriptional regulator [Chloroflexota bacterium]|nr:PadR family transcriptional regulator [Chloroflexota bacterium]